MIKDTTQLTITCSKLRIETLEQGVKYVQVKIKNTRTYSSVSIVNIEQVNAGWEERHVNHFLVFVFWLRAAYLSKRSPLQHTCS